VPAALDAVLRRTILAAARSRRIAALVSRYGMRLGAGRFVAGETLDECLDVLAQLNERGLHANTTLLGEDVRARPETEAVVAAYEEVLDRIAERGLRANVALKLTHLGLLIDEELAYANLSRLVDHAGARENFIRIDMENSPVVDATLHIYRRLRESGRDNVGCVLQAYLFRAERDLEELLPLQPNLRLVKGAYLEPPEIAYPRKPDVDAA
jgi:proline dehydrogenase